MNCSGFEEKLEKLQQGLLTAEELQSFNHHLETCTSCRELIRAVSDDLDIPPLPVPPDLTRIILERTSGPACGRAREHLCDFVDGVLESGYAAILSLHLENCRECSTLTGALAELKEVLPQMGEIDPGLSFTFRVLRSTSRKPSEPLRSPWPRLRHWWHQLIQRPRFSWEAAYLGTVILVGLLGNPLTSFHELSLHIAEAHQSNSSFSLVSVALPGSLVRGDTGILKDTREFASALSARQAEWVKSAEGLLEQGAHSLRAATESDLESVRSLPYKAVSSLKRAWAALFPTHFK